MKKLFTLFLFSFSLYVFSQVPNGYYTSADGKNTSALRTALQSTIPNRTHVNLLAQGICLYQAKTNSTEKDISFHPNGIYIIRVQNSQYNSTYKIIK